MAALLNVPLLLPLISGWLLQGITAKDGGGLADTILNFSDNQTCPVRLLPAKTLSRGQFAGTLFPGLPQIYLMVLHPWTEPPWGWPIFS